MVSSLRTSLRLSPFLAIEGEKHNTGKSGQRIRRSSICQFKINYRNDETYLLCIGIGSHAGVGASVQVGPGPGASLLTAMDGMRQCRELE